jgi:NAD(P)-dependent dehydrogenase (short-subunit alcohol dehydrogenase family)
MMTSEEGHRMEAEERVAFVTGGGRNIGESIALALARDGMRVAIVDLDEARAHRTADLVEAAHPGRAFALCGDVSRAEDVRRLVREVVDRWGGIDVLVNNVAITDRGKNVLDLEEDEWERVLRVTLGSAFLCAKYVAREMVKRNKGGRIVNIGSTSGHRGRANATAYSVAKAGVINLTRSLAVQLAPYGIRANTVTPNKIGSPVGQEEDSPGRETPNLVGRAGRPADVANAVSYLVSEEADFMTAGELLVDGGALLGGAMD